MDEQEEDVILYKLDKDEYFKEKYASLESILIVNEAEECLRRCNKPKEIVSSAFEKNLSELQSNVQLCYRDCEKFNEETKDTDVDYQCIVKCLDSNIQIVQEMDKRMNDEFLKRSDSLFIWDYFS